MRLALLLATFVIACGSVPNPPPLDAPSDRSSAEDAQEVSTADSGVDAVAVTEDIVLDAAAEDVRGDNSDAVAVTETGVDASTGVTIEVWTAATDARPRDVRFRNGTGASCTARDTAGRYPVRYAVTFEGSTLTGYLPSNSDLWESTLTTSFVNTAQPTRARLSASAYMIAGVRRFDLSVFVRHSIANPGGEVMGYDLEIVITGCILVP